MIRLDNVSKVYASSGSKAIALDGVTLHVPRNAFFAIVGRSGSGKSTLLNIIGGLTRSTGGKVVVDDIDLSSADEKTGAAFRNEKVGFVFQSFHVPGDRTALENVMLPARFSSKTVGGARRRAYECLEKVGLAGCANAVCSSLSGGQLQRVAIARALLMNPPLLLADEPTGNLDIGTGTEILELFSNLHREEGLTLVVVTHEENVASAADQVMTLDDGKFPEGSDR